MIYLLSTNTTTEDPIEYITDFIKLNMSIRLKQIPYFAGGTDNILKTVVRDDLLNELRTNIQNMLARLTNIGQNSVELSAVTLENSTIKVVININKKEYVYDIAI